MQQTFRARGPNLGAYVGLAVALGAIALVPVGFAKSGVTTWTIFALVVVATALSLLIPPSLYAFAGRLVVERGDAGWRVTYALWRWQRTRAFPPRVIHHVERFDRPLVMAGPSRGLLVHIVGERKPVPVGVGLELTDAELAQLEELLAPEIQPP